ncbi:MAG: hypothetical protein ACFCGT_00890 [Sandaracinaceae bacterium]
MGTLTDTLTSEERRGAVVQDTLTLIDSEVASKGGLGGMAIKAGYAAVKGLRPNFLQNVVHDLLPEFAASVEPFYDEAVAQDKKVSSHFVAEKDRVADALLSITDRRAERTSNRVVKATYDRLRSSAKKNVVAAVPRLGELVERHTS